METAERIEAESAADAAKKWAHVNWPNEPFESVELRVCSESTTTPVAWDIWVTVLAVPEFTAEAPRPVKP